MSVDPRRAAQLRADRIRAFREELAQLRADRVSPLTEEQASEIDAYHDSVLEQLARDFDIDETVRAGRLSRGMRLASFLGAVTLMAAVTSLIHRVWGGLMLPAQLTLLCTGPLLCLAGVQLAAERERTGYVAALLALAACGTAWFAIFEAARLLDLPMSALLLWPCVGFGLALAFSYGFPWVLAASLALLVVAVASAFFVSGGVPWTVVFARFEPLVGTAFVVMVAGRYATAAGEGFASTTRLTGLTIGLGGLLILASIADTSLLAFAPSTSRIVYQVVMLLACVVLLWRCLRADDGIGAGLVTTFLLTFLLIRYVDWFWDLLPAWVFFFGLTAMAFGSIAWLRRLRGRQEAA